MKRYGKMLFAGLVVLLLLSVLLLPALAETETDTAKGEDLLALDNEVKVTEVVSGDLLALTMELTVQSEVRGSIRACAGDILLNGVVGRNVTVAGTTVLCDQQFDAKDVKVIGNQVVFLGACDTLSVYGSTVYIGGTVRELLVCEAGQVVLLEGAEIASAEITSSADPLVANRLTDASYTPLKGSAFEGVVKFTKTQSAFVSDLIDLPITLLVAAAMALVMTLVCKRLPERIPSHLKAHPLSFCLRGFAAVFLIPLAAILLLMLMVFWPVSASLLLLYVVVLLLANSITAVILSRAWLARWNPYLSAVLVAAIFTILSILPFIGLLVRLFGMTVGFGAVVALLFSRREPMVHARPEMDFRV